MRISKTRPVRSHFFRETPSPESRPSTFHLFSFPSRSLHLSSTLYIDFNTSPFTNHARSRIRGLEQEYPAGASPLSRRHHLHVDLDSFRLIFSFLIPASTTPQKISFSLSFSCVRGQRFFSIHAFPPPVPGSDHSTGTRSHNTSRRTDKV